jgi:hypothetical protein
MIDTVERMVDTRMEEMTRLAETHGVQFASSCTLSTAAHMAGAALALCKDEDMRQAAAHVFITAMVKSMRMTGAEFEAIDAIRKAKA